MEQLKAFKIKELKKLIKKDSLFITVYGRRRAGKSTRVAQLYKALNSKFDRVYVFTLTACNEFYNDLVGKSNVVPSFDTDRMKDLIDLLKSMSKETRPKVLFILDDIICDDKSSLQHSKTIDHIATAGRHVGITCICTTQRPTKISPTIRDNTDFAIVFDQLNADNRKMLSKQYSIPPEYFNSVYTKDYHCLVIDCFDVNKNEKDRISVWI